MVIAACARRCHLSTGGAEMNGIVNETGYTITNDVASLRGMREANEPGISRFPNVQRTSEVRLFEPPLE